jgi:AraC-like DNA-binding protein
VLPDDLFARVQAYLKWCYLHQTAPRVQELAIFLAVSRATLHRMVRNLLRTTPSRLLKTAQREFAKVLIMTTNHNLTRIAYDSGFGTRTTFFRAFRTQEGISPGQLRETK